MSGKITDKVIRGRYFDPYRPYREIIAGIPEADAGRINREIRERIRSEPPVSVNNALLTAGVLFHTGSKERELIDFLLTHIKSRISIDHYLFFLYALFENKPPVSSDIMFDLVNYTYLDKEVIQKKLDELTASLKGARTPGTVLFLLLLSFRQDVANENLRILVLLLNNIAPEVIVAARKRSCFPEYGEIIEEARRAKIRMSAEAEAQLSKSATGVRPKASEGKAAQSSPKKKTKTEQKPPVRTGERVEVASKSGTRTAGNTELKSVSRDRPAQGVEPAKGARFQPTERMKPPKLPSKQPVAQVEKETLRVRTLDAVSYMLKRRSFRYLGSASVVVVLALLIVLSGRNGKVTSAPSESALQVERGGGSGSENILTENLEDGIEHKKSDGGDDSLTYTVKTGDTLSHISKRYFDDANHYREIAAENKIEDPDLIYPDQQITINPSE
jgi:nucleoid-associated protein YgaU